MRHSRISLLLFLLVTLPAADLFAQYFGRNKMQYEHFDFKVSQSPNFEFYHYLEDKEHLQNVINQSEDWFKIHQTILKDTIEFSNPFILYNNHADFQQTKTIQGTIGVGTGGVTEAFKNRVVLPLAMSNQQTNHVIGHELVHAYQYNMIIKGDSTSIRNLGNIPLWMIEGLAEYMSIGRVDAHTAMWMRDAVLNDDVPSFKKLNNYGKYFPYRWGQVFWSFLTSYLGDDQIAKFFEDTALHGLERAILINTGMKAEEFSDLWVKSVKDHFGNFLDGKSERTYGRKVISEDNAGRMNISPAISPDGKYVAFLSEKDLFGIDVYMANAATGKGLRKITSSIKDDHYDDLNYLESAGSWSPNGYRLALVAVDKGNNTLLIKNALDGKTIDRFEIKDLPAFSNPAWSPDGQNIVVSGLVDGQIDLYSVNPGTKEVTQLTDDIYSELLPSWSSNGEKIAFATDKISMQQGKTNGKWTHNLAILNLTSGESTDLDIFPNSNNLNPVFDAQDNIYFISNRDGYRDLYKYVLDRDQLFQMTDLQVGISGITQFAPAISVSQNETPQLFYTEFLNGRYSLHGGEISDFLNKPVDRNQTSKKAASLIPMKPGLTNWVDKSLNQMDGKTGDVPLSDKPFKNKFKLDYINGGSGIGVSTNNTFGTTTGLAGSVDMIFGDILGDNQFFSSLAMNGEIYDFGAQGAYINRKNRVAWGFNASHMPNRTGIANYEGLDTLVFNTGDSVLVAHYQIDNIRVFTQKLEAFAEYPISPVLRVESGVGISFYSNRVDRSDNFYDASGQLLYQEKEKIEPEDIGLRLFEGSLWEANAAIVGDRSFMGVTSPLAGYRFRVGTERFVGGYDFSNVTIDLRKYFRFSPVTLAVKAVHYGRYGNDASRFYPFFLGSPWYMRGLKYGDAETTLHLNDRSIDELFGERILLTNFELRLPFTGPERLAQIPSKFFYTDLNLFVDGGAAFNSFNQFDTEVTGQQARFIWTAGASVRINLFGAIILEPYYAVPLLKDSKGNFGLNLLPGW